MKKVWILLLAALTVWGQNSELFKGRNRETLTNLVKGMEVKARAEEPSWARRKEMPLLTVAWLSDLHLGAAAGSRERAETAFHLLRDGLKPDLTVITGDNAACEDGLPPESAALSQGARRNMWMKLFLERELSLPYVIIPGDNWPWGFEDVFGSPVRSFDCRGFHFLFLATDAKSVKNDLCAIFDQRTKSWVMEDLRRCARRPCLVFLHETVFPPMFLDAPWLEKVLTGMPQALALFSGHLHFDLEFARQGYTQFVCPALGPGHRPAFKLMKFYRECIVLCSYEWNGKTFAQVRKWQRLAIPKALRPAKDAGSQPAEMTDLRLLEPYAKRADESLAGRAKEVEEGLRRCATQLLPFMLQGGAAPVKLPKGIKLN